MCFACPSSPTGGGRSLSISWISIEMRSPSCLVRTVERALKAVINWATVSAIPPSTLNQILRQSRTTESKAVKARGFGEIRTALVTIVVRTMQKGSS